MQKRTEKDLDSLDSLSRLLQSQRTQQQTLLTQMPKAKNIEGNLRIDCCKKSFQYYIISERGDTKGTYIRKRDLRKAAAIAQRDYNKAAADILNKQIASHRSS